jgi:alcohol dehydrogenase, propanol-preferring
VRDTYKAVEVYEPGRFRVVERPLSEPGAGQVRIRVEACGICHTDATTVTGTYPGLTLPRVPGHEVVGRIETLGAGVSQWKIGQRVGVGLLGGEDGVCEPCRRGDIVNCQNPVTLGVTVDGGYAELMIAEARGIASIPDELSSAEAAPLLCAGITTYTRSSQRRLARRRSGRGAGHWWPWASWYPVARRMGFHTVAIGRGREKEKLARDLGAHVYIDTAVEDAAAVLQRLRGQSDSRNRHQWRCYGAACVRSGSPRQTHRGRCARGPDPIECVPARLWRALDLREPDRHAD